MENRTKRKKGTLSITTDGEQSQVQISGTPADIMFNWTALTHQVSETLGIEPVALAVGLPQLVSDYKRTISAKNGVKMEVLGRTPR